MQDDEQQGSIENNFNCNVTNERRIMVHSRNSMYTILVLLLVAMKCLETDANAGSTHTSNGGSPLWVPDVPAAPYPHPEVTNNPNELYEPSIPGRPVVSEISSNSLRLTWSPPQKTIAATTGIASSIAEYRIYKQEYQWSESYKDGSSEGKKIICDQIVTVISII